MQQEKARVPNSERTARTRAALMQVARDLFARQGFAATGTPEIVAEAGLTRGALHHHFADKRGLFAAVVDAEHAATAAAINASAGASDAMTALRLGAEAYLAAMQVPGRVALLLIEGPAVLGAEASRLSDTRHGLATLGDGLSAAMAAGEIASLPLNALTEVLGAAFDGAALAMHRGRPRAEVEAAIQALLDGLRRRDG